MKKYKLINIINFICIFCILTEILLILDIFLYAFSESTILFFILSLPALVFTIPLKILEKILNFFPVTENIKDLILILFLFVFFTVSELFLIIEKYKFENYFFPYFSDKTRHLIIIISVIGFIINIPLTTILCLGALF